ncbi:MAG TPA: hypothetical protein VN445_09660 [Rectinemataceae bacterium]|nr:hypothetical protein [Rectinemataceae bacterium]
MDQHDKTEPSPGAPYSFPCLWPSRFSTPKVDLLAKRLKKIFESLPHLGYLGSLELKDYSYYEHLIVQALYDIDEKARRGEIHPLDTRDYPKIVRYPGGVARVAMYIGSFDPFQLTHLTIALRLLASPHNRSDIVIVVPEGSTNPGKPKKTDYPFRFQIAKMQLASLFEPFILPLDLGSDADTIEIVRRFIAMHTGMRLELTHLIGSDVLSVAARYIEEDLGVWRKQAALSGVEFSHSVHVARRETKGRFAPYLNQIRSHGVPVYFERCVVGTPSSTDFRQNRAITLFLPTESIRDKLEIIFRYNMNQPWSMR